MSKRIKNTLLIFTLAAGLLMAWGAARAAPMLSAAAGNSIPQASNTPQPLPDQPAAISPDISFIDSPTASCILPRRNTGECLMTWSYMYADASPNYMITMTVGIDDSQRARYHGFFQQSMYVPGELMAFQVQCGAPGSGGDPNLGLSHSYTLRARDSSGLGAANYGTVTCPAYTP